jgi:hypothetical protein
VNVRFISRRECTVRTKEVVRKMSERFREKGDQSIHKMAKEFDLSYISLRIIVKNDI